MEQKSFSSKFGVLMAAAGSAVGLGSIWKFPYVVGENGGGAFILLYIVCTLFFGLPLVMSEFMIGKLSGKSAYGAYRKICGSNRWQWLSWINIMTVLAIMSFYFVVTGWCINYMIEASMDTFAGMDAEALTAHFKMFEGYAPTMVVYAIIAIVLTTSVLWFDVNKGIERLSKILMPLLFVILIVLAFHMMFLDGGITGLRFLFEPDFSKINAKTCLEAMGLSFFTLSVGMGILITYGAYMPEDQDVKSTTIQMILLETMVSLLAGMIIFPAVFAYGFTPSEGPQLAFVTLPAVFQHMFSPTLTSVTFFFLMCIAALTSTISMMEVAVAFIREATSGTKHPLNRHQSVVLTAIILVVTNILCILSMTGNAEWLTVMGKDLFTNLNAVANSFLIPIGALGLSIYSGWFAPSIRYQGSKAESMYYLFILRWVVPIAIVFILLEI